MKVSVSVNISKPKEAVWSAVTNIEQCVNMISSINAIEILNKPETGFIGFKWKETRTMFGKEATEIMWVTDAAENAFYTTCAQSHGSVYISHISVVEINNITTLSMSFTGEAQTTLAKILSAVMSPLIRKSMINALQKDLDDIKRYLELN